jgi:hypothetical protein
VEEKPNCDLRAINLMKHDFSKVLHFKNIANHYCRDTCTPVFTAILFTAVKKSRCISADEWIKKLWCLYPYFSYKVE